MKVLILGGYGVFGGRLARLLLEDGHQVLVAGRDGQAARRFCCSHGGTPVVLDMSGDLEPIAGNRPDVVVDAAGPFQAYGDDPYRVARVALAAGAHYLDLSDDGRFTAGIVELDPLARAAGCFVLSGVSSVPALSSAAVEILRGGLQEITLIEAAILPGNRAPRGRSVIASILAQAGNPLWLWRGGRWRRYSAWSGTRVVNLCGHLRRWASFIGAPDLVLFPGHFQARSVVFRAGLELATLHLGLAALASLRRLGLLPCLQRFSAPLTRIARWLEPFGSDRGGMQVEVTGPTTHGEVETRRWTLIAERGEGPFIPAVPARVILRHAPRIPPGARPCVAELPLHEFVAGMAGLRVRTATEIRSRPGLFRAALGERWHELPPELRRLHGVVDCESFSGRAEVTRGDSLLAKFAATVFRFPKAGKDVPLTLTKTCTGAGETWERNFNGRRFRSHLAPAGRGRIRERFWPFDFELQLPVADAAMQLPVCRGWLLGIPIPQSLLPLSIAQEYSRNRIAHFDVGLYAPLGGALVVRYRGWVTPDAQAIQGTLT